MNDYEILGVSTTDTPEFIRKRYKFLARKYHPDTTTLDKTFAEQEFKKISVAYENIKNGGNEPDMNFFTQKIIEKATKLAELFKKIDKNEVKNVLFKVFNNMTDVTSTKQFTEDINVTTHCTIDDIYSEQEKAIKLVRIRRCKECIDNSLKFCLKCNNKEYCEEEKIFSFFCNEKAVFFHGESNQKKDHQTGDICFRIIPKKHELYTIVNDYDIQMTIYHDSSKKLNHKWNYLDKKQYIFAAEAPLSNEYTIESLGLKIPGSSKRGKLIIKIDSKKEDNLNFTFNQCL